jgi:lipoyl(octanoyl) transferase
MRVVVLDGLVPYPDAHALMQAWVEARIRGTVDDVLLMLEHPPTLTFGRARGAEASILDPGGWPVYSSERGGDATLHAPGQWIVWPILALAAGRQDLTRHLRGLESGVSQTLRRAGLDPRRDARNTGVWLPRASDTPQKVGAIGIACRRWVTWHGLALNVDIDLSSYSRLRPCGFDPDTVTRVADHVPGCPPARAWAEPLAFDLASSLEQPWNEVLESASLAQAWAMLPGGPPGSGR